MRTPDGKECPHYYQDFHRGHSTQECRLLKNNEETLPWKAADCARCPVPGIAAANANPDLHLTLTIRPIFFGLGRRLDLTAHCVKHDIPVKEPHVGCPQCAAERPGLDLFIRALEDTDDQSDPS